MEDVKTVVKCPHCRQVKSKPHYMGNIIARVVQIVHRSDLIGPGDDNYGREAPVREEVECFFCDTCRGLFESPPGHPKIADEIIAERQRNRKRKEDHRLNRKLTKQEITEAKKELRELLKGKHSSKRKTFRPNLSGKPPGFPPQRR